MNEVVSIAVATPASNMLYMFGLIMADGTVKDVNLNAAFRFMGICILVFNTIALISICR